MFEKSHEFIQPPKEPKEKPENKKKLSDYEIFFDEFEKNHGRESFDWTPYMRKGYLEQGVEFLVDVHDKRVDTMVFMDKRARPLAGLFRAIWARIYPDQKTPAMRFLVSRPKIIEPSGTSRDVAVDYLLVRQIFAKSKPVFRKKRILFVDEEILSGDTLKKAEKIIKQAFPDIGETLFGAVGAAGEEEGMLDIGPVWSSRPGANALKNILLNTGDNLGRGELEVRETGGLPVVKAKKGMDRKLTNSYRLRQVGKYETLDKESLRGIDGRITEAETEEEQEKLKKVRAIYEKLIKT